MPEAGVVDASHHQSSWEGMLMNVRSRLEMMKVHYVGGVCCQRKVDGNANDMPAPSSSDVQRYACRAFCASGFRSDMPPKSN